MLRDNSIHWTTSGQSIGFRCRRSAVQISVGGKIFPTETRIFIIFKKKNYFHWKILALDRIWTSDLPSPKPIHYQLSYSGLNVYVFQSLNLFKQVLFLFSERKRAMWMSMKINFCPSPKFQEEKKCKQQNYTSHSLRKIIHFQQN